MTRSIRFGTGTTLRIETASVITPTNQQNALRTDTDFSKFDFFWKIALIGDRNRELGAPSAFQLVAWDFILFEIDGLNNPMVASGQS